MGLVYTLVNQKGGVGKTTTAVNLGAFLAQLSKKVLIVDLDPQANATSCLGIDKNSVKGGTYNTLVDNAPPLDFILHNPRLKLSLLPSTTALAGAEVELVSFVGREVRLREALKPTFERYDYILIDCPPSLGLLTLNGLVAAKNGLIIPVQCEYLALEGISQLIETINLVRNNIYPSLEIRGVVMTMFDRRTRLSSDVVSEVQKYFQDQVFQSIIPRSIRLAEAPSYGQPINEYSPDSSGAQAYLELAKELLEKDRVATPTPTG